MDAPGGTAQGAGAVKKLLQLTLLAVCLWITLPLCGEVILPPGTPVFSAPAHNQKIVAVAEQAAVVE